MFETVNPHARWNELHVIRTQSAVNIVVNKIYNYQVRYHYSRDRITIALLLWRHQQSIVTSSAERRPSEWARGRCVKTVVLPSFLDSLCRVKNKIVYSRGELFLRSPECYLCLIPSFRNAGNEHKNNPLVSAEAVTRHSSTFIILYIFIDLCTSAFLI